jgi:ligand-binding sensor domain-containing protein/signal transduction histidine kinase
MIKFAAKILCFLTLVLWLGAAAFRAERLPLKTYTSADGLGSSAAFHLIRDTRGFVWLCSRDGLVRFDGYRFITYRIGDETADPAVFHLVPTRRGDYWINLNRGTDYRFREKSDANLLLEPLPKTATHDDTRIPLNVEPVRITPESPFPIFEDAGGNLWAANGSGIFLVKEIDGRTVHERIALNLPGNPSEKLLDAAFRDGRDGDLWIGTHWGVVRRLRDGGMIHYQIRPAGNLDPVSIFAEDKEGRLWIARSDGILVVKVETLSEILRTNDLSNRQINLSPGSFNSARQLELPQRAGEGIFLPFAEFVNRDLKNSPDSDSLKPEIFGLICASDGKIWITSNHGMFLFDGKRFHQYTTEQGLGSNTIASIVEDHEGYIWASSYGGLHRINTKGLTSFDQADGLERERIHSIYENRNGELQVVSGNFHISGFQNSRFQMARPQLPAGSMWTWQSGVAFLDSRGDWWVNSQNAVYRYSGVERLEQLQDKAPSAVYDETNGLQSGNNLRIFEDSNGDIWFSSWISAKDSGLTRWRRATNEFEKFPRIEGLPDAIAASTFEEDAGGNLWIGFTDVGIIRYRDGRFTRLDDPEMPKGGITHIFRDRLKRIWIATSREGLVRVDNPTDERPVFKRYTIADGLTSNNVRCVTEDLNGNIYIGTVRGVNRLNPENGRVKYYGTSDGLASDFINTAYRDRAGMIWFGTFNGLSKLVPETEVSAAPPTVIVSGLRIAGEDYPVSPLGQRDVLVAEQAPERNNLQIDFLSINTGGGAVRYQYRLDGANQDWSVPSAERSVTFANLSPGGYQFLVRAVNAEGVASENPARVSFSIARPYWQRWSFRLVAALLITLIVYGLYRYRIAQIIKLERVRTRLATDLHDDIGSSLSKIAILSEVVRQKNGGSGSTNGGFEPLEIIANTSREMVDSMSDIVWAINPERDHLSDLIQRMRHFAEEMLDAQEIEYEFSDAENLKDISLGADLRREVYLIFKECVNNLAKHSEATRAEFDVRLENESLIIEIKDNGRGFTTDSLRAETSSAYSADIGDASGGARSFGGNGLQNMRRRARNLGGDFVIDSAPGAGTRLRLEVPVGKKLFTKKKMAEN